MTFDELVNVLKEMWARAGKQDRVATMHLFGIRHAAELKDYTVGELRELSHLAGGSKNYGTELRKMVRLSKYVSEKYTAHDPR